MIDWSSAAPSVLASFMASLVECVEALTIVLAVGIVRGWRSALLGSAAGLVLLALLVALLGRTLAAVPLPVLQLVVGVLLLMFGMRWLRKAVLRTAGVLAVHDEGRSFDEETRGLRSRGRERTSRLDRLAFITTFKAVMLEGIEVVFIVIALGAGGGLLVPAAVGAALALLVVVALGLWLHRPLTKVPENALKFGVGVMLAAFGTFWAGEGVGLHWPGADAVVVALVAAYLLAGWVLVRLCGWLRLRSRVPHASTSAQRMNTQTGRWHAATRELPGLFVDDGVMAAALLLWVLAAWWAAPRFIAAMPVACAVFAAGLVAILAIGAARRSMR
jgi:uncharacterized membrane protein